MKNTQEGTRSAQLFQLVYPRTHEHEKEKRTATQPTRPTLVAHIRYFCRVVYLGGTSRARVWQSLSVTRWTNPSWFLVLRCTENHKQLATHQPSTLTTRKKCRFSVGPGYLGGERPRCGKSEGSLQGYHIVRCLSLSQLRSSCDSSPYVISLLLVVRFVTCQLGLLLREALDKPNPLFILLLCTQKLFCVPLPLRFAQKRSLYYSLGSHLHSIAHPYTQKRITQQQKQ